VHRLALEGCLVRTMPDAVEDGVDQLGFVQLGAPSGHLQMARDERRARVNPVFQQ
jgi:hypothetical protein